MWFEFESIKNLIFESFYFQISKSKYRWKFGGEYEHLFVSVIEK